jgi:hypothetical protein
MSDLVFYSVFLIAAQVHFTPVELNMRVIGAEYADALILIHDPWL